MQVGRAAPPISITAKALKEAARGMRRASAMYVQPHHIRAVANSEGGVAALLPLCVRIVNGDMPAVAVRWLTCQKVVALSKTSHHQADIDGFPGFRMTDSEGDRFWG